MTLQDRNDTYDDLKEDGREIIIRRSSDDYITYALERKVRSEQVDGDIIRITDTFFMVSAKATLNGSAVDLTINKETDTFVDNGEVLEIITAKAYQPANTIIYWMVQVR